MLATAALAFSPGPDNIYVLMQSVVNGKKYGLATSAGLMSGCLVHTTLVAFGVSAIIKENETLFFSIKLLGALYLFYLAFQVFRSESALAISRAHIPKKGLWKSFQQGFVMNVLNPKVTIFFLALFPGFLFSDTLSTVLQFYVLGGLFVMVSSVIFGSIAILSSSISQHLKESSKIGVYLKWVQISVFVGIAVYLLLSDK